MVQRGQKSNQLKHTPDNNGSKGLGFLLQHFGQNHFGHQHRLRMNKVSI